MEKAYEPKKHEQNILQMWKDQKISETKTKAQSKTEESFCVPIPPPNVTGQLHLGHAMMLVIQDIMTRYHRMKGDATLWLPGTDHAAIATETVVLKNLGVASREEFSRPEFLEKCFDHTAKTHATITNQVQQMGASCDFSRERFTMDLGMNNAVQKIFADLYKNDLIVRGHRMVNWSTGAQSVLADDELEYEDQKDTFCYIKCGKFVMGTVRSETKCADSPLVIHPTENYVKAKFSGENTSEEFIFSEVLFDDEERRNKIFNQLGEGTWEKISTHQGKEFEGEEFEDETYSGRRKFFVLCDDEVIDINKGTGAMTISVCHSADDYLLAKKYPEQLKDYYFEKIDFDGKMTEFSGELEGVEVKIARKRAVKLMLAKGLIVGLEKDYLHNVPLCYRTGCVVEPMISPQWFIDVNKEFDWQENVGVISPPLRGGLGGSCDSHQENKIFYARHGQSEANVENILQGSLDSPLTEKGIQDAKNLAKNILDTNITTIISSTLQRAKKTAEIVKSENNIDAEIIVIPELNEIDFGKYTGTPFSEVQKTHNSPIEFLCDEQNICGETPSEIFARLQIAQQKIQEIKRKSSGNIVVVAHGQLSAFLWAQNSGIASENFLKYYQNDFVRFQNGEVREINFSGSAGVCNTPLQENHPIEKKSLKSLTYEAVLGNLPEKKKVKLIPSRFDKIYHQWIDNLQDWCISRQIWWGHQIPIWYDQDGNQHVAKEQKLLFTRHGESENNVKNLICGDSPLTEKGREEARELGEKLISEGRKITKIIVSPLERTTETGQIIQKILEENSGKNIEIETWDETREINTGKYDNTPHSENGDTVLKRMFAENEGESASQLIQRMNAFWKKASSLSTEGDVLVIGHRTVTSLLFAVKDGATAENLVEHRARWKMNNCEVKEVTWMVPPKGSENMRQDEDTLDTWFSSALWPFSTLGWPDKTPDMENFFPTSVLETGHDILFFWVARMIMFSRFATGKNPFEDVYLHGLVCDEHGKKMSKSKGNGIDPLEMIDKFGTDAVRMSLVIGTTPGNQVNLGEKKIEGFRNFANKLWNVSRYILSLNPPLRGQGELQSKREQPGLGRSEATGGAGTNNACTLSLPEQWILSKTQTLITEVSEGIENHKYGEVGQKLYDFTWNDLADWAIESAKAVDPENSETIGETLREVLTALLKLLHPYIPFVTEQIWKEMGNTSVLALENFPEQNTALLNQAAEAQFLVLQNVIGKIRSLRSASKVDPVKKITAVLNGKNLEFLKENSATIVLMGRLENLEFGEKPNEECVQDIIDGTEIFLPLAGMLDMEKEKERKAKELEDAKKMLKNLEGRIANKKYMDNAPEHLVAQTKAQYEEVKAKIAVLES